MCKGSQQVNATMDAQSNSTLGIGTVKTHSAQGTPARDVGALHKIGETTAQCVHCIKTGQMITLGNIPAAIQKAYGLGKTEVATFIQTAEWYKDDQLVIERTKTTIDLGAFANQGVTAFVGVKTADTKKTVDTLLANAATGVDPDAGNDGSAPAPRELEQV